MCAVVPTGLALRQDTYQQYVPVASAWLTQPRLQRPQQARVGPIELQLCLVLCPRQTAPQAPCNSLELPDFAPHALVTICKLPGTHPQCRCAQEPCFCCTCSLNSALFAIFWLVCNILFSCWVDKVALHPHMHPTSSWPHPCTPFIHCNTAIGDS